MTTLTLDTSRPKKEKCRVELFMAVPCAARRTRIVLFRRDGSIEPGQAARWLHAARVLNALALISDKAPTRAPATLT